MADIKLYDVVLSQNGYKARILLSQLGLDFDYIEVDVMNAGHKKPDFMKMNPNGQIPTLVDGEDSIWESNAILSYLAKKYAPDKFIPTDTKEFGQMVQWLFFESCKLQAYMQPARFMTTFQPKFFPDQKVDEERLKQMRTKSNQCLKVLNDHLESNDFLAGKYSIADIACYAQVYPYKECGLDLDKFPAIQAWKKRVEAQPGYVDMSTAKVTA